MLRYYARKRLHVWKIYFCSFVHVEDNTLSPKPIQIYTSRVRYGVLCLHIVRGGIHYLTYGVSISNSNVGLSETPPKVK